MIDSRTLGRVAERLVPGYLRDIPWRDLWERPVEQGKAFEWTTLAALVAMARGHGWTCSFPLLAAPNRADFFEYRNSIPRHHGARVGHSGHRGTGEHLRNEFLAAFIPKVMMSRANSTVCLFREGNAYHEVMTDLDYEERPDMVLVAGAPSPGFPRFDESSQAVLFAFDFETGMHVSGALRPVNSPTIPLLEREPEQSIAVPVLGLIECSVNKSAQTAQAQIGTYSRLFSERGREPKGVLVTGNELANLVWPNRTVPMNLSSIKDIEDAFRTAGDFVLSEFGLL